MNKQQLASRIWRTANEMRSSIDAGEYKDYILGFVFYKFLSENEVAFLKNKLDWEDADIREDLNEGNERDVESIRDEIGYFISYDGLFSTWIDPDYDFTEGSVVDALNAFSRNIKPEYAHVYGGIFDTLSTKLSKLGETAAKRTSAINAILELINPIPMASAEGYDVLGFIYEYLISNFAANAGKKAGEFYTPHEVSELMSDIVAHHLAGKTEISIYDPTSGSASLLLNIGQSIARLNGNPDGIRYYAQEKNEATYNLTRMNLVMKGIKPANIVTRRADTLEEDWPLRSDSDQPLRVDACVSNPPYSQKWKPKDHANDPRFLNYGLAPRGKADYAFLLHSFYHLRPDGIMTIVMPHGVLFRGDAEGQIRTRLVEEGAIDAIIGLPANIFFGTGIPTIIMVLKPNRNRDDILFIDASKGLVKQGNKNRLRSQDIRRAFDAYVDRRNIDGYCRVVEKEEIVRNGCNLNISRYVDSTEPPESWDIYSTMFGGVPRAEIDQLGEYWNAFPGLREELFELDGNRWRLRSVDVSSIVQQHESVMAFRKRYREAWAGFDDELAGRLIGQIMDVHPVADEETFVKDAFARMSEVPLVDPYRCYQCLDDQWARIVGDLEIIQDEGLDALNVVDPHTVIKKDGDKEEEVVDNKEPWVGRILPFDLVQRELFPERLDEIASIEKEVAHCESEIGEILGGLDGEEREGAYVKESGEGFDFQELGGAIDELYADEDEELASLIEYRAIGTSKVVKPLRLAFVREHPEVDWGAMKSSGGCYAAKVVNARISDLRACVSVEKGSLLARLMRVAGLNERRKTLEAELKSTKTRKGKRKVLHDDTKDAIESLSTDQAFALLRIKWVDELMDELAAIPDELIDGLTTTVSKLNEKYAVPFEDVDTQIERSEHEFVGLLGQLDGDEDDIAGIRELIRLMGGEQ